jgi:hypothetical protein
MGLYLSMYEWYHPLYMQDHANNFTTSRYVDEIYQPQARDLVLKYSVRGRACAPAQALAQLMHSATQAATYTRACLCSLTSSGRMAILAIPPGGDPPSCWRGFTMMPRTRTVLLSTIAGAATTRPSAQAAILVATSVGRIGSLRRTRCSATR